MAASSRGQAAPGSRMAWRGCPRRSTQRKWIAQEAMCANASALSPYTTRLRFLINWSVNFSFSKFKPLHMLISLIVFHYCCMRYRSCTSEPLVITCFRPKAKSSSARRLSCVAPATGNVNATWAECLKLGHTLCHLCLLSVPATLGRSWRVLRLIFSVVRISVVLISSPHLAGV